MFQILKISLMMKICHDGVNYYLNSFKLYQDELFFWDDIYFLKNWGEYVEFLCHWCEQLRKISHSHASLFWVPHNNVIGDRPVVSVVSKYELNILDNKKCYPQMKDLISLSLLIAKTT